MHYANGVRPYLGAASSQRVENGHAVAAPEDGRTPLQYTVRTGLCVGVFARGYRLRSLAAAVRTLRKSGSGISKSGLGHLARQTA